MSKPGPRGDALTPKGKAFIKALIDEKSPTHADRVASMKAAGFEGTDKSLAVGASRIVRSPAGQNALQKALEKYDIGKVVQRLAEHAEADYGDVTTINDDGSFAFDLAKAKALGKTHLIRKLKHDAESGAPVIELVDSQAALDKLAKMHKAYGDKDEAPVPAGNSFVLNVLAQLPPASLAQLHRALLEAGPDDVVDAEPA